VLAQTDRDFELRVVGDGCEDETEEVVKSIDDKRVMWRNMSVRYGTQSFANSLGLMLARGDIVAYIGHDDIWAPTHLENFRRVFAADPGATFAVAGGILHTPPGVGSHFICGLHGSEWRPAEYFFPPSTLAHRAQIWREIGLWGAPTSLRLPVDSDFQLRAVAAGYRFRATGRITTHKFTSTHRYLSYLAPESDEQENALARLLGGEADAFLVECLSSMRGPALRHPDPAQWEPGAIAAHNMRLRGPTATAPLLEGEARVAQGMEPRGLDWWQYEEAGGRAFRWSGPNPRPKLLVPYRAVGEVEIVVEVISTIPDYFDGCHIFLNGAEVGFSAGDGRDFAREIRLRGKLLEDRASYLRFDRPNVVAASFSGNADDRRIGIAVGEVIVRPCS
jgi:hypothetical protein